MEGLTPYEMPNGEWWWVDEDGNLVELMTDADLGEQVTQGAVPEGSVQPETVEEPPGEDGTLPSTRRVLGEPLTNEQSDELIQWNESAKERKGVPTIGEGDAARARAYMELYPGLTFVQALNVFDAWRDDPQGLPGPGAAADLVESIAAGEASDNPLLRQQAEAHRATIERTIRQAAGELPPTGEAARVTTVGPPGPGPDIDAAASRGVPDRFSPVAKRAYAYAQGLNQTDPRALIDSMVRWYAKERGITDEAEIGYLSLMIQRIAAWESGLGANPMGDGGESWGLFHCNFGGRGAGYSQEELLDPILNTIISVEELLTVGDEAYPQGLPATANALVRAGQRPDPANVTAVNNMVDFVADTPGASAGGGAGGRLAQAAAGRPGEPGAETIPSLTPEQHVDFTNLNQLYDLPLGVYQSALIQGRDPLTVWFEIEEAQLQQAKDAGNISDAEYDAGIAERLSLEQIAWARDQELDFADYRSLLDAYVSDGEIAEFLAWGYEPDEYLWGVTQGLSHGQMRTAQLEDRPLEEVVAEARMPDVDMEMQADFDRQWKALWRSLPFDLATDPAFSNWLRIRQQEETERLEEEAKARRERQEARITAEVAATMPGAPAAAQPGAPPGTTPVITQDKTRMYFDPKTREYVSELVPEEEKVEPYKAPSVDLLLLEGARAGVPMLRPATSKEMGEGTYRGATRQVLGGGLAGPRAMPARQRYTAFGRRAMGPMLAQEYLAGRVLPGRGRQAAAEIEEHRRAAAEEHPELARQVEEEGIPIPQPEEEPKAERKRETPIALPERETAGKTPVEREAERKRREEEARRRRKKTSAARP